MRRGASVMIGAAFSSGQLCRDRKSTRLNSSHGSISYAVSCLKKKRAPQEGAVLPRHLANRRRGGQRHLRGLAVRPEVVLAAEVVVVDPRRMGHPGVDVLGPAVVGHGVLRFAGLVGRVTATGC